MRDARNGRAAGRHLGLAMAMVLTVTTAPPAIAQQSHDKQTASEAQDAMVLKLLSRLDLERYKATIKGLTQFGDRRQGTERNRKAVDWIEAQLRSYGCPTDRIKYVYDPPPARTGQQPPTREVPAIPRAVGGGRPRGVRTPTSVNTDPQKQPDEALRALNAEPAVNGPREEVYCTKVGTRYP